MLSSVTSEPQGTAGGRAEIQPQTERKLKLNNAHLPLSPSLSTRSKPSPARAGVPKKWETPKPEPGNALWRAQGQQLRAGAIPGAGNVLACCWQAGSFQEVLGGVGCEETEGKKKIKFCENVFQR